MVNRVQTLRSSVAGNRPTGRAPGELYVNFPDGQLGVITPSNAAQDLVAVRYFSSTTNYNVGDCVFYNGSLYSATAAVSPGAFNAAQWTTLATKQYVDTNYSGFVNKLRNGTFDVWQRGTTALPIAAGSVAYTADGWRVVTVGAATTADQVANSRAGALTLFGLRIYGAAGLTNSKTNQIIESYVAAALAGRTCTFQCWIWNATGATLTPTFDAGHFSTADNGTTGITDTTAALQPIPNASFGRVAYTFVANAGWNNGGFVELNFGGAQNGAGLNVQIFEVDLRTTTGLSVGLNSNPPPPELRPVGVELPFCQRYYESGQSLWSGNTTSGQTYYTIVAFRQTKRGAPTITATYVNASGFPATAPTVAAPAVGQFQTNGAANASGTGFYQFNWTASAEI